jgi:hypothetical protein
VTGARVDKLETKPDMPNGRAVLDLSFAASRYARLMQQKLLIMNPVVVSRRDSVVLTEPVRKLPIEIEPEAFSETTKIKIPSEFAVDEMPENTVLETPFGTYRGETVSQNGNILFRRSLLLHSIVVPPEQYEMVKGFFLSMRKSEESPIVLIRK